MNPQEEFNGGQAVPIYQLDSQAGTLPPIDSPPHLQRSEDSQTGTTDLPLAPPFQLTHRANINETSLNYISQSNPSNIYHKLTTPKKTGVEIQPKKLFKYDPIPHRETTPKRTGVEAHPRKLFNDMSIVTTKEVNGTPEDIDLEVLLINSCKITATKVQTIVNNFIEGKKHTVIFCMTETKVDSHDFQPIGITIFSAHRSRKEIKDKKKGGGLAIGYASNADISLKEIKTKSNDLLVLEGSVLKSKFKIILCYFDSTKSLSDQYYKNNRKMQS